MSDQNKSKNGKAKQKGEKPKPLVSEQATEIKDQAGRVLKAIDGFWVGLTADPTTITIKVEQGVAQKEYTNPINKEKGSVNYPTFKHLATEKKSILTQVFTDPSFWTGFWTDYKKTFLQGKMSVGPDTGAKPTVTGLRDKGKFKEVLKDQVVKKVSETPKGAKLLDELKKGLGGLFVPDLDAIWVNKDFTGLIIPVAAAVTGGAVLAGTVNAVNKGKHDKAASVLSALVPKKLFKIGDIQIGADVSKWVPSKGEWQVSTFAESEWQVWSNFKYKARVDLFAGDKTWATEQKVGGKATGSVSYNVGSVYLDSLDADASMLPGGKYEVSVRAVKNVDIVEGFQVYLGLEQEGQKGSSGATRFVAGFSIQQ